MQIHKLIFHPQLNSLNVGTKKLYILLGIKQGQFKFDGRYSSEKKSGRGQQIAVKNKLESSWRIFHRGGHVVAILKFK